MYIHMQGINYFSESYFSNPHSAYRHNILHVYKIIMINSFMHSITLGRSACLVADHLGIKALSHGAIFLATCNAILLLRDVKLANTSYHHSFE